MVHVVRRIARILTFHRSCSIRRILEGGVIVTLILVFVVSTSRRCSLQSFILVPLLLSECRPLLLLLFDILLDFFLVHEEKPLLSKYPLLIIFHVFNYIVLFRKYLKSLSVKLKYVRCF